MTEQEKYITPKYETISIIEKRNLIEITQSSLIIAEIRIIIQCTVSTRLFRDYGNLAKSD